MIGIHVTLADVEHDQFRVQWLASDLFVFKHNFPILTVELYCHEYRNMYHLAVLYVQKDN